MNSLPKCESCPANAEVIIRWYNIETGTQKHKVCAPCAHDIWDKISTHNGTEAYLSFTIEPLILL